jgi:hypothetical protein
MKRRKHRMRRMLCEVPVETQREMPSSLDELRVLEREIEREWWWLNGALHAVAQVNSGDPHAYLEMLTQKRAVDRRRVEIATRISTLIGPPQTD